MLKHLRSRTADKNLLEKGFTLVELLVVIVILGILAAVVVFAVGGTTKDASVSACVAERSTVESAVEAFKAATGDYPQGADELLTGKTVDNELKGKMLRHLPHYWTVDNSGGLHRVDFHGLPAGDAKCLP